MVKANTLTQNTTYYTVALVFQKILAFAYFTFLARGLGVENLGKYAFAFAYSNMMFDVKSLVNFCLKNKINIIKSDETLSFK